MAANERSTTNLLERLEMLRSFARRDGRPTDDVCVLPEAQDEVDAQEALSTLPQDVLAKQIQVGFDTFTDIDLYLGEMLTMARRAVPSNTDNYAVEAVIECMQALREKHVPLLMSLRDATAVLAKRAGA